MQNMSGSNISKLREPDLPDFRDKRWSWPQTWLTDVAFSSTSSDSYRVVPRAAKLASAENSLEMLNFGQVEDQSVS